MIIKIILNDKNQYYRKFGKLQKNITENVSVHTYLVSIFINFLPVLVFLCLFIYYEAEIIL